MDDKFPYPGAGVWYVPAAGQVFPAEIIATGQFTAPDGSTASVMKLCVKMLNGFQWVDSIQDELGKLPGTWHWPRPSRLAVAHGMPANGKRVIG